MKPSDPEKLREYVEFLREVSSFKDKMGFDANSPKYDLNFIVEVGESEFIEYDIRNNGDGSPNFVSGVRINDEGRKLVYEFDHPPFDYKKWTFWTFFWLTGLSLLGWILVSLIL